MYLSDVHSAVRRMKMQCTTLGIALHPIWAGIHQVNVLLMSSTFRKRTLWIPTKLVQYKVGCGASIHWELLWWWRRDGKLQASEYLNKTFISGDRTIHLFSFTKELPWMSLKKIEKRFKTIPKNKSGEAWIKEKYRNLLLRTCSKLQSQHNNKIRFNYNNGYQNWITK